MKKCKVISGSYVGREGMADFSNTAKTGNIMFYPKEGINPYRVCLRKEQVEVNEQSKTSN